MYCLCRVNRAHKGASSIYPHASYFFDVFASLLHFFLRTRNGPWSSMGSLNLWDFWTPIRLLSASFRHVLHEKPRVKILLCIIQRLIWISSLTLLNAASNVTRNMRLWRQNSVWKRWSSDFFFDTASECWLMTSWVGLSPVCWSAWLRAMGSGCNPHRCRCTEVQY